MGIATVQQGARHGYENGHEISVKPDVRGEVNAAKKKSNLFFYKNKNNK